MALLLALLAPRSTAQGEGDAPPASVEQEPVQDGGQGEQAEGTPAEPEAPAEGQPKAVAQPGPSASPPRYRPEDELDALFQGWLGSGLAERIELGTSAGGRAIVGLVFGGQGQRPLAERPTILLVGGLDGVSTSGAESVLRVTDELLSAPERLPSGVAYLAIPWANPDGLARTLRDGTGGGRNDAPRDDDGDGAIDEDGPDDLDGDGVITSLLIEDPDGPYARALDDRLLRPARPGDAPRFLLVREGRDDDADGRFNEDGAGGIVCDLDFPVDWRGPWTGAPTGPWPLSSPESLALAELVLSRRIAVALLFQGSHGGLASPGGVALPPDVEATLPEAMVGTPIFAADRIAFEHTAKRYAEAMSRETRAVPRLMAARGEERPGAALDWLYLARGVLAVEVAAWGPEVEVAARARPRDARFSTGLTGGPTTEGEGSMEQDPREAPEQERAWAAWVDNTRGGIGFLDWQPIELGGARAGWIGGWLPHTRQNPPPDLLPEITKGLGDFARALGADMPSLGIEVLSVERSGGEVCVLKARVRNRGALASGVGVDDGGLGVVLSLDVPEGAEVLVGERTHDLGTLAGGAASAELSWVLLLPESAAATLRVATPWLPEVVREVRP